MGYATGIRFKRAGKIYYFDGGGMELKAHDRVVVETERGLVLGQVAVPPKPVPDGESAEPLKPILRRATPEDLQRAQELRPKNEAALATCQELVPKHRLPMKLLSAEYNLDGTNLTVFFSAEGRVDFREMVKELAAKLKTKVELRQVGPRDETKLCGGYGRCGLQLCCARYLTDFQPVSIKMAKEQDLPLHPTRISGVCGRLLCCLGYETELYRSMKENLPSAGLRVSTPLGPATVVSSNPLKQTVLVELESQTTAELPLSQVTSSGESAGRKPKRRRGRGQSTAQKPPPPAARAKQPEPRPSGG